VGSFRLYIIATVTSVATRVETWQHLTFVFCKCLQNFNIEAYFNIITQQKQTTA